MERRYCNRNYILNIEKLIKGYINNTNSNEGIELGNMKITGEDLLSVIDNLGFETDEEMDQYREIKAEYEDLVKNHEDLKIKHERLEENHKRLINQLELIIQNSVPGKIKELITNLEKDKSE